MVKPNTYLIYVLAGTEIRYSHVLRKTLNTQFYTLKRQIK